MGTVQPLHHWSGFVAGVSVLLNQPTTVSQFSLSSSIKHIADVSHVAHLAHGEPVQVKRFMTRRDSNIGVVVPPI
jgi:hypothetical protein